MAEAGLFVEFLRRVSPDLFHKLRNFRTRGTKEEFGVQQVKQSRGGFRTIDFFHLCDVLKPSTKQPPNLRASEIILGNEDNLCSDASSS